jgi:hypothetical protein
VTSIKKKNNCFFILLFVQLYTQYGLIGLVFNKLCDHLTIFNNLVSTSYHDDERGNQLNF